MDNRVKAAFSYVFGWITGIIFLAIEKDVYKRQLLHREEKLIEFC